MGGTREKGEEERTRKGEEDEESGNNTTELEGGNVDGFIVLYLAEHFMIL